MRNKMVFLGLRIAVFAAVLSTSASLFAGSMIPIAPSAGGEGGAMVGPVGDGPAAVQPPIAVPEPATIGMLLLGGGLLTGVQRFRRRRG